jgi:hypothetical protein
VLGTLCGRILMGTLHMPLAAFVILLVAVLPSKAQDAASLYQHRCAKYPPQFVGSKSPAQRVTLFNRQGVPLNISGIGTNGSFNETTTCGAVSRLSWKWRKRSSVKIAERTYEKRAQALPS